MRPATTPTELDPVLLQQLSRIGNNLNQITRRLHQFDAAARSNWSRCSKPYATFCTRPRSMVPKLFKAGETFQALTAYLLPDAKEPTTSERASWTHALSLASSHPPRPCATC